MIAHALLVVVLAAATARAQGSGAGTSGAGSAGTAGAGSAGTSGAGSAGTSGAGSAGTTGAGSAGTSGAGSAGTSGAGSAAGSATAGSATGSATAGSATGSATAGSATGSGAGKGSATVIQLPVDEAAPRVSAAASPADLQLGQRFILFVMASDDDGVVVNLREPIELGGAFEVRGKTSEDLIRDGKHVREWQIEVVAWDLGELRLPPVQVTFTARGRAGQIETNTVPIRVHGVLGDMVDDPKLMRDNAPPVVLTSADWFWAWVGAAVGAVVAAIVGVIMWRRRRRRRVVRLIGGAMLAAPIRIDATSEHALARLLAIEQSGVLDRDDDRKLGYAEMVEVIRDYLGGRYAVATVDLTTAELQRALAPIAPAAERQLVDDWLGRCDLVKYGGQPATRLDAHATLADARALVVATGAGASPAASPAAPAAASPGAPAASPAAPAAASQAAPAAASPAAPAAASAAASGVEVA